MNRTLYIAIGLVFSFGIGQAQETWPGGTTGVGGSYNLTFPPGPYTYPYNPASSCGAGAPAASFYQRPGSDFFRSTVTSPKVVAGFSQLPQTNDWWTSAIWNYETTCNWAIAPYSFWMYPHPLQVAGTRYGMKISYEPVPTVTPITYFYQSETHLYVGLQGMDVPASTGMKVKSYSDWAATFQWNDGARNLEATSAHGSPYVYFNKDAASTFTLRYQVNPGTAFSTINNANVYAIGVNILGKYYGIFMPPGSSLSGYYGLNYNEANVPAEIPSANATRDAQNVTTPVGHNYMSVAVLPDNNPATLAYYAQFAFAFISDTKVSWSYNQANAQQNSTFTVTTSPQGTSTETRTLMALYRHQWLNTSASLTTYSYVSPRGQMKVMQGNSFTTAITQYGLLSGLPNVGTHNKVTLYSYVDAVYNDNMNNVAYHMNHQASLYDVGVKVDRMIDLIHTADAVGHTAAKTKFIYYLKTALEYWLRSPAGKSDQMFWYDPLWKTLVAYPQAFESDRQLNDHHFHYGYIIKGAATIIQYEPNNTWLTQWGPMVEHLIRDVANWDRTNTQYPFLRNFDPYAGHSWASGHANFQQGNNQESSSEALNFASGVTLYGTNSGNITLRDLGLFLYSNEVAATQQYWFDVNNATFPASYANVSSGIVWGRSSEYQTWFGGDPEFVHAINYLPITGASFYLGWDSLYAAQNYAGMVANNGGPETVAAGWRDLFWMYEALFDPSTAKSKFNANAASYIPQTGQSKPFTYLWISMLDSIGKPYNVTANTATYSVFRKGSCIHYVVYNPPSNVPGNPYAGAKTVTFSDGFVANVPADTTIVFKKCLNALPIHILSFIASVVNHEVLLEWKISDSNKEALVEIERSVDGVHWNTIGFDYSGAETRTFLDKDAKSGVYYYRIKQVDTNGHNSYSDIRSVNLLGFQCLTYSYSPETENLTIQFSCRGDMDLAVYDMTGKLIYNKLEYKGEELGYIDIPLAGRASGVYLIKVDGQISEVKKFVKPQ